MKNKDLRQIYYNYLRYFLAKDETTATSYDKYMALAYVVRSELTDDWIRTLKQYSDRNVRRVYFLSMEYIFGKSMKQNILNAGIAVSIQQAVAALGFSLKELCAQEDDFELGNSGKGRMASCYLDSLATLGVPAMAYGLRYDYAQFQQNLQNGMQIERPYDWLHRGHPWEIIRPEYSCAVDFNGKCVLKDENVRLGPYAWSAAEQVHAIPYDVPIAGYDNDVVNTLRLWSARASEEFLPDYINHGDYVRACEEKSELGRITKVLFPEEDVRRSTEMRMKQQFFFVSASLQDIIRRFKTTNDNLLDFDRKVVIHLNGSRCALAIPELMRILVDIEGVPWKKAWSITQNVFSYTSHAMHRDHIESWPVYKVTQMLPRHMQIMFDINQIHLENIRNTFSSEADTTRELSLIEEGDVKRVRLANLAVLGSFCVNGVSRVQTEMLRTKLFPVHDQFFVGKFRSVTTGVAHRRWLLTGNPDLAALISDTIGTAWTTNAEELAQLEEKINDSSLLQQFSEVKMVAKRRLCTYVQEAGGRQLDPYALFDIQVGKVHPGKRQVLHLFHILNDYLRIKTGGTVASPRVHIFSGKASPSDFLAKQVIHLINVVSDIVNTDEEVSRKLAVAFIPDFGMTEAEHIIPAADLSEHLSAPIFEAAGTFNMKFAFNGAITLGSRCGSNLELAEKIGEPPFYTFGKMVDELQALQVYAPSALAEADTRLKAIFTLLEDVLPLVPDGNSVYPLISSLKDTDRYYVVLDFDDYIRQQERIDAAYGDQYEWGQKCLLTIARSGCFSSDRTIREYAKTIWKVSVK